MEHSPDPDWENEKNLCDLFLQYDERNCTSIFVSTFALLKVLLPYAGFLSGFGPRGGKTAICNFVNGNMQYVINKSASSKGGRE